MAKNDDGDDDDNDDDTVLGNFTWNTDSLKKLAIVLHKSSWVPSYLLDFMSDFVHVDATVICFLLIITVPALKHMYTG